MKAEVWTPFPWDYLSSLRHLDRGRHLLLATGDFGQRRKSRYESHALGRAYPHIYPWLDERFSLLAFESTDDLAAWNVALLPFVLAENAVTNWIDRFRWKERTRDLLFSFSGAISYPQLPRDHIRGGRLKMLCGHGPRHFIGTSRQARERYGRNGGFEAMMRRSVFTLGPAGFGRGTFRMIQALRYGSIPIVLSDGYCLPFLSEMPWQDLVLLVTEENIADVPDLARSLSTTEIRERQEAIGAHRHLLTE